MLYLSFLAFAIIALILSLSRDWSDWVDLMNDTTGGASAAIYKMNTYLGRYFPNIAKKFERYSQDDMEYLNQNYQNFDPNDYGGFDEEYYFEKGKTAQRFNQYLDKFEELVDDFENLSQLVNTAMSVEKDFSLAHDFRRYNQLLEEIHAMFSKLVSSPTFAYDTLEKQSFLLISQAEALSKKIASYAQNIINKSARPKSDTNEILDFFQGCTTEEEIKRRYRGLSKVYHPDMQGHAETFKAIHKQYETMMEKIAT
jgi:preprotein translocase subunit Sec63